MVPGMAPRSSQIPTRAAPAPLRIRAKVPHEPVLRLQDLVTPKEAIGKVLAVVTGQARYIARIYFSKAKPSCCDVARSWASGGVRGAATTREGMSAEAISTA